SVDEVLDAVETQAKKNMRSKAFHATVNQENIPKWRHKLTHCVVLFNMELHIASNLKLDELLAKFREFQIGVSNYRMSNQEPTLPARPRVFVGRDGLVKSTVQSLIACHHVALIGPGGIGKSTIARAVLNDERIAYRFQGRRFFTRFDDMDSSQVNLGTFLDQIVKALGLATSVNVHNQVSNALSTSDTLLVLDNAETFLEPLIQDAGRIADVIDELGARLNVAILITTRTIVLPPNIAWVRLQVPVLEESAACEAFRAYYPAIDTSILIKLLAAVDFHPLSINLLAQAAVQNEWSPQALIFEWNRQRAALLEAGNGKIQSLTVTIETSLNSPSIVRLGKIVPYLLQIIAFLPQGINKTRLTAIFPGVLNIETCADALCKQSLAYLNGDFITLLAPIRLYIMSCLNGNISTNPFFGQVRSLYAAYVRDAEIVGQENVNIESILIHWLKAPRATARVLFSIKEFLLTLSLSSGQSVSLHQAVSTLDISKLYSSVSGINFNIRVSIFQRYRVSRARLQCLLAISHLMRFLGQIEEAEGVLTEARAMASLSRSPVLLAHMETIFATVYFKHGNYLAAEHLLQQALKKLTFVSAIFMFGTGRWRRLINLVMHNLHIVRQTIQNQPQQSASI
ncbi:hypothetical protein C0992_002099, partial [Termitomyces sp. T32_za158]